MNNKSIRTRVGVIGCGAIAKLHLAGYQKNNVEITALADINKARAEDMAKDMDNNPKCFNDYKALLESGQVDLVSICTPPVAHEEAAVFALERNIHVLLEKPLAHSVESGKKIMTASKKSEALLMPAFRHRFLPAIQKIQGIINQGKIGQIVFFENIFCGPAFQLKGSWFSQKAIAGGGTLMDTSIHSIDLFRYLIGEVVEQKAVMHQHFEGTDVEDASIIILKAENGAVGSLIASWVAGAGIASINITGQDGRIIYDYSKSNEIQLKYREKEESETISVEGSDGVKEQIGHFLKAIQGKTRLSCTGRDGLRSLEIVQVNY